MRPDRPAYSVPTVLKAQRTSSHYTKFAPVPNSRCSHGFTHHNAPGLQASTSCAYLNSSAHSSCLSACSGAHLTRFRDSPMAQCFSHRSCVSAASPLLRSTQRGGCYTYMRLTNSLCKLVANESLGRPGGET